MKLDDGYIKGDLVLDLPSLVLDFRTSRLGSPSSLYWLWSIVVCSRADPLIPFPVLLYITTLVITQSTNETPDFSSICISSQTLAMTNSLRALFSRKERAKRKNQQTQQQQHAIPQIPPAYKASFYDTPPPDAVPRSAHPRPLSSFAPDYSRQSQYGHGPSHGHGQYAPQQPQHPRASLDIPPPRYPALPTYDPSKYQPIQVRPTSTYGDVSVLSSYAYQNQTHLQSQSQSRNQSSRLSAAHYTDARNSIYQPPPPPAPRETMPYHARRQSAMPVPAPSSVARRSSRAGEVRERSVSEPGPGAAQGGRGGSRRAKPVLSRLITNFG